MKKISLILISLVFMVFSAAQLFGKCYTFRDGGEYKVCVQGDSFDDRKKAMEICKKAKGSDCGSIASYSSSCHSNAEKCYDENGKAHRSLRNY